MPHADVCLYLLAHCGKINKVNYFCCILNLVRFLLLWRPAITCWYIRVSVLCDSHGNTLQDTVPHHTFCTWHELLFPPLIQTTCANMVWRKDVASDYWILLQGVVSVKLRVFTGVDMGEVESLSFQSSSTQQKVRSLCKSFWSHIQSRGGSCLELSKRLKKSLLPCMALCQITVYHPVHCTNVTRIFVVVLYDFWLYRISFIITEVTVRCWLVYVFCHYMYVSFQTIAVRSSLV
jgi:hypothetical protein